MEDENMKCHARSKSSKVNGRRPSEKTQEGNHLQHRVLGQSKRTSQTLEKNRLYALDEEHPDKISLIN